MKRLLPLVLSFAIGISGYLFADTPLSETSKNTVVATQAAFSDTAARADMAGAESEAETTAAATTEAETTEAVEETSAEKETSESTKSAPETTEKEETTEATKAETRASKGNTSGNYMWPTLSNSRVIAGYPYYPSGGSHSGIDIGFYNDGTNVSRGNPIFAARDGVVVAAFNDGNWNTGFGNYCIVDHGNGVQTLYAHAEEILVSEGDTVSKGETLGRIGDTGNTTAPHLHFEVRVETGSGSYQRTNPLKFVSEP